jgi:hypothetical protein
MAVKRSVVVDPGTVLTKVVHGKKSLKHPSKQIVPSHSVTVHKAMVSPVEIGASPKRTASFDSRLFLAKLAAGKTSREYQAGEFVFSQGARQMRCSTSKAAR